jgi:hypothetical protein
VTWVLTIVGIMHILEAASKDLLSESIEFILIFLSVVLDAIAILIDDVSINLSKTRFDFLIIRIFA